jgi:hypothetical protein
MMSDEWTTTPPTRRDGVRVEQRPGSEYWQITFKDGRKPLLFCPCCDKPMASMTAAMLVADHVSPMGKA